MPVKNAELDWQSTTPLNKQFNDPYFSLADGLAETEYVFLKHNQLPERWRNKQDFVIAETGFGTGLNFLVTASHWFNSDVEEAHLTYFSVEKYPLSYENLAKSFGNWPQFEFISHKILKNYPDKLPGFHILQFEELNITLVLMIGDVLPMLNNMQSKVDCWFLDGFAPAKNPDMWVKPVCQKIADLSHENTSFATFTAAGEVRRNLQSVGFDVKKTPGFGKKREMLSGVFVVVNESEKNITPWFDSHNIQQNETNEVVIIGGGLAGLSCAWELSQQKVNCTLIEAGNNIANGASGNAAGIVLPRLSLDVNLESQFYIVSFLYAVTCLNLLKNKNSELLWNQSGVIQLADKERIEKISQLKLPENFIQNLSKQQTSDQADVELSSGGLLYPAAGYVNPYQLCETLVKSCSEYLKIEKNTSIQSLKRENDEWLLLDGNNKLIKKSKTIIFANGYDAQGILQLESLSLSKSRGQLSYVPTQDGMRNLKLPVCAEGYIIPEMNGSHIIGATYGEDEEKGLIDSDHLKNLQSINIILSKKLDVNVKNLSGRVSFRTTSLDHLPLVGPVYDESVYRLDYEDIRHGRKEKRYPSATYLPGIYLSTGHGSRGLVSCFSSAAYLTSLITGKPVTLAENIRNLLHPARFLIRSMKKH